jgi:uncharacterized protein YjaG (DUF416 family)
MRVAMTETIPGGSEAFLEFLRDELRMCAPAHHVSFAAVLAERGLPRAADYADWEPQQGESIHAALLRLAWPDNYADWEPRLGQRVSMRQILGAVWDHACGRSIAADRLCEFEANLQEVAALVDPDRYASFDVYRAIWLLQLTTRCCAPGVGAAAATEVARASLCMSAGYDMSDWELREKWDLPDIQAEARLQSKLAQTLRAIPQIERDIVETLRRDFVT